MNQYLKDNPILLSTGVYFRAFKYEENPINKVIEFYSDNFSGKISGIELRLKSKKDLLSFKLSKKSVNFLAGLKCNTLHYFEPIQVAEFDSCKESIANLHNLFCFKNFVVHPRNNKVFEVNYIKEYAFSIGIDYFSIENLIDEPHVSKDVFENLLNEDGINFLLDVSHSVCAYTSNCLYRPDYLSKYFNKIKFIHVSSARRDLAYTDNTGFFCPAKGHSLFHETDLEDIKMFDWVRTLIAKNNGLGVVFEQMILKKNPEILLNELDFFTAYFIAGEKVETGDVTIF